MELTIRLLLQTILLLAQTIYLTELTIHFIYLYTKCIYDKLLEYLQNFIGDKFSWYDI